MGLTQTPGRLIKDGSITEADLAFSDVTTLDASTSAHGLLKKLPNVATQFLDGTGLFDTIAISDVTNLQSSLDGKSPTTHNHNLNDLTEKSYSSLTDKPTIPAVVMTTATDTLTLDLSTNNFFVCTLNANTSFSLSNVSTAQIYYFIIKSSNGAITITLPNTADVKAVATFTISATNKYKECSMIYNGSSRFWQISEELT